MGRGPETPDTTRRNAKEADRHLAYLSRGEKQSAEKSIRADLFEDLRDSDDREEETRKSQGKNRGRKSETDHMFRRSKLAQRVSKW